MEESSDALAQARESLLKTVLELYREEYKVIGENLHNLEGKAQGSVAIAGIFIAGAFAYLQKNITLLHYQKIILCIGIIFLLICVGFSILALRIRKLPAAPMGQYLDKLVSDLLRGNDPELLQRLPLIVNDQITSWREVRIGLVAANHRKGRYVWNGQIFLVMAIAFVGILTLFRIFFS
jgi:ABC-type multidrug transport system fused ATPase/permease subunit